MSESGDTSGASLPSIDELVAEWRDMWLEHIKIEIFDMHHRRQIHDGFTEMLDAQDHPDTNVFVDAFHRMYVESQAAAIRRQTDDDPRTISLRRLIGQLEQHRKAFTRESYVKRWMQGHDLDSPNERDRELAKVHLDQANAAFNKFTDAPGEEQLSGRCLQRDRDELDAISEGVVQYVNEHVAHTSSSTDGSSVTYGEFHAAIEHLETMLKRYHLLIDQGGLVSATPTIQGDWKGPFRKPLATP